MYIRESIEISCTVVMGPSSGTLTFRRLTRLFWFNRIRIPAKGDTLGVGSVVWGTGRALPVLGVGSGLSLGKS